MQCYPPCEGLPLSPATTWFWKHPTHASRPALSPRSRNCLRRRARSTVYALRFTLALTMPSTYEIRPDQSVELLKALHILTRDGKMNQDSRRKLKQVYHLFQFIEPLLNDAQTDREDISLVDHGAGKSYLG